MDEDHYVAVWYSFLQVKGAINAVFFRAVNTGEVFGHDCNWFGWLAFRWDVVVETEIMIMTMDAHRETSGQG